MYIFITCYYFFRPMLYDSILIMRKKLLTLTSTCVKLYFLNKICLSYAKPMGREKAGDRIN